MKLSHERWLAIQQAQPVRTALLRKANKIAARARATASAENVDTEITVTSGTRPKGRPFSRVTSSNAAAEHGTSWTKRSRVLGRSTFENGPDK